MKQTKIERHTAELITNLINGKKLRVQILIRKKEFSKQRELPINTDELIENVEAQSFSEHQAHKIHAMGDSFYQILCLFGHDKYSEFVRKHEDFDK